MEALEYKLFPALMAQIKGIGFHAMTGKLKQREIENCLAEIGKQVEYWLSRETE